jgi:subtilisin family serine protease
MRCVAFKNLFLTLSSIFVLNSAFAQSIEPTHLTIKMKPGKALPKTTLIENSKNLFGTIYIVQTNQLENLEAFLKNNSNVEYIERNEKSERTELPKPFLSKSHNGQLKGNSEFNDPMIGDVWSFDDASSNGVSVTAAYKANSTSATAPVIVAVVDTGMDAKHEDLKDIVWVNQGEIPGNGIDDDNNGYIDDVYGINTLVRDSKGNATGDIKDTHSHGTHVSGTIGAKQNNKKGIAGIASNVKIMAIRSVPNSGDETDIDIAESFIYAAKNGARIINCSFGKSSNEGKKLIPETLKYIADNYGVLVIAAAGNNSSDIDRTPTYPASHPSENLLIIASTTSGGKMSYFSNYGKVSVDVAAPGSDILSSVPGNKYESMSGTSMATPTTVGVAAEILSHYPQLTYKQLKDVIMNSVTQIGAFKTKTVSGGRIDLLKGLELARSIK